LVNKKSYAETGDVDYSTYCLCGIRAFWNLRHPSRYI